MTNAQKQSILIECKGFTAPQHFAGGCRKTKQEALCVHFKTDGQPGKIQENCKCYSICKGWDFKYNI